MQRLGFAAIGVAIVPACDVQSLLLLDAVAGRLDDPCGFFEVGAVPSSVQRCDFETRSPFFHTSATYLSAPAQLAIKVNSPIDPLTGRPGVPATGTEVFFLRKGVIVSSPLRSNRVPPSLGLLWQATGCRAPTALEISVNTNLEVLEAEVLKLEAADRSHLLERLIASLDVDPEVEQAWEQEADRREAELESGSVTAAPGHEAIARLRAKLTR